MRAANGITTNGSTGSTRNGLTKNPEPAPFAAADVQAIDAPMWPIHPVVWFQPELTPGIPASSGLGIERHHKIPMPDFLQLQVTPDSRPDSPEGAGEAAPPNLRLAFPQSGLAPVGWDPRAVTVSSVAALKKEGQ